MSDAVAEATEPETDEQPETVEEPETVEPDSEPDEPEPEPEHPEDEPQAASNPEDFDKAQKALARSATSWRNAVSRIMGEDAQHLAPCPLCPDNLPGFVFPDAIPDEHRAGVIDWLRGTDAPPMMQDPDTQVCDVCGGHGHTLTGSPVPDKLTKLCGKCNGNGFTTANDEATWKAMHPPATPAAAQPFTTSPVMGSTAGLPATDAYGRPAGTEFYGRDPLYMSDHEKARDPWSPKA